MADLDGAVLGFDAEVGGDADGAAGRVEDGVEQRVVAEAGGDEPAAAVVLAFERAVAEVGPVAGVAALEVGGVEVVKTESKGRENKRMRIRVVPASTQL